MNFATRYQGKELLDNDDIPFDDIAQNMKELNTINSMLGGHAITVGGYKALAKGKNNLSICEIGCGGGDNLAAIHAFAERKKITVKITGIDLKPECILFAQQRKGLPASATFIASDYRKVSFHEKPDIIFSSLFCHHFTTAELIEQFKWMKENATVGFFVNDLQRHPVAYYSIKFITQLFSSSYLVKHDAPVSVRRGFSKQELVEVCRQADANPVQLDWRWAFRFLLVYKHG